MPRSPLRSLLRHIALGTPLVVGPAGIVALPSLLACGTCPPPTVSRMQYALSADEQAGSGGEALSCESICRAREGSFDSCVVDDAQHVTCVSNHGESCGAGRLPLARAERRTTRGGAARQRWLLETATLELSAVSAFGELARALEAHGAPRTLARRADAAQADEVRHARALMALVEGPARVEVAVAETQAPSLFALALHNAREGCVHEALGALDAAHQALHAPDADLRAAMARIARDEARHALLSLDIDAWARARLTTRQQRALDDARIDAARALAQSDETIAEVGLFDRSARARGLLAA